MPHCHALFRIRMVGRNPNHPRYIVRDARRLVDHVWTGHLWSRRLEDARLYQDPNHAFRTIKALTRRHLRRHLTKQLFTMTLVVRIHADELVSRGDIESYLRDALVVGVNHKLYGTGPIPDSLVEVCVPVISLEGR